MPYVFIVIFVMEVVFSGVKFFSEVFVSSFGDLRNEMFVDPKFVFYLLKHCLSALKAMTQYVLYFFFTLFYDFLEEWFFEDDISKAYFVDNFFNNGHDDKIHTNIIDFICKVLFYTIVPKKVPILLLILLTVSILQFSSKLIFTHLFSH